MIYPIGFGCIGGEIVTLPVAMPTNYKVNRVNSSQRPRGAQGVPCDLTSAEPRSPQHGSDIDRRRSAHCIGPEIRFPIPYGDSKWILDLPYMKSLEFCAVLCGSNGMEIELVGKMWR